MLDLQYPMCKSKKKNDLIFFFYNIKDFGSMNYKTTFEKVELCCDINKW
jgi:arginyl-tRNA--protein-N-Asp/Glu arginylyltransferase